jgi:UPF0042 nucleotide-binding protein
MIQEFWIITGMSGSGKSIASKVLEDIGFFCIDNLPIQVLPALLESVRGNEAIERMAVVIDARQHSFLKSPDQLFESLKPYLSHTPRILFLDCDEKTLARRFSESRRPHPLSESGGAILDGIRRERALLSPLREAARIIVNTSQLKPGELKNYLFNHFDDNVSERLKITVLSFGFKHGLPPNADNIFDVRFLPNPYWESGLREYSGEQQPVIDFLQSFDATDTFLEQLKPLVSFCIQAFQQTDRHYYTIAIGCTGGQHRSVYMARQLSRHLEEQGVSVQLIHRDKIDYQEKS